MMSEEKNVQFMLGQIDGKVSGILDHLAKQNGWIEKQGNRINLLEISQAKIEESHKKNNGQTKIWSLIVSSTISGIGIALKYLFKIG